MESTFSKHAFSLYLYKEQIDGWLECPYTLYFSHIRTTIRAGDNERFSAIGPPFTIGKDSPHARFETAARYPGQRLTPFRMAERSVNLESLQNTVGAPNW